MNLNPRSLMFGRKRWAVVAVVLVGVLLLSLALAVLYKQKVAADRTKDDVEAQFHTIPVMPLAVSIQHNSLHDWHQGVVNTAYKTGRSYQEIKAYHDRELAGLGWRFKREAGIEYDGKDYGGKELVHCTGSYIARLQYAGQQETEFGWTYSIGLSWGLSDECK